MLRADPFVADLQAAIIKRGRDLGYTEETIKRAAAAATEIADNYKGGISIRPSYKSIDTWAEAMLDAEISYARRP